MINVAKLVSSIGFQIERQSLKEVNATFNNIEKRLAALRGQFSKGLSFGTLRTKGTLSHINGINKSLSNMHKNMRDGLPAVNDYTKAIQQMASAFANARANLPRLPRTPNGITGGSGGAGGGNGGAGGRRRPGGVAGFMGGLIGSPMGLAATFVPGVGAGWAIREAINTGRSMQSTQLAYQAVMGDPSSGDKKYQKVLEMARNMKMDAAGSTEAFKGLLASSINAEGFGKTKEERAAKAQDIFRGVSSYGLAIGLDDESMKGSLKAIQQMMGKGKVYSEELTQQLAERMPAATQILADSMGVTVAQLYQMLKDGKVMSADVLPKMAAYMERIATDSGALAKYMDSSLAKQREFKNNLTGFIDKLWKNGGDEALGKLLGAFARILEVISPIAGPLGKALVFTFERLSRVVDILLMPVEGIVKAFQQMSTLGLALTTIFGIGLVGSMTGVATSMRALGAIAFRTMLPFTMLYLLLDDIAVWRKNDGGKSLIGELFGGFEDFSRWMEKEFFAPWDDFLADLRSIETFFKELVSGKVSSEVKASAAKAVANTAVSTAKLFPGVESAVDFLAGIVEHKKRWSNPENQAAANKLDPSLLKSGLTTPLTSSVPTNYIEITVNATGIEGTGKQLADHLSGVLSGYGNRPN